MHQRRRENLSRDVHVVHQGEPVRHIAHARRHGFAAFEDCRALALGHAWIALAAEHQRKGGGDAVDLRHDKMSMHVNAARLVCRHDELPSLVRLRTRTKELMSLFTGK